MSHRGGGGHKLQTDDVFFREGSFKSQYGSISGGEGVKNGQKLPTSFMDGPYVVVFPLRSGQG